MSEWQFASREGMLVWSSAAMLDGGQELYSQLSPTLLMGYQQQGDPIPLDFIKLSSVGRVELGGSKIELVRKDGVNTTLTALNPNDAQQWVSMIELAMQGMNSSAPAAAATATTPAAPHHADQHTPRQPQQYVSGPEAQQSSQPAPRSGGGSKWTASSYEQYAGQLGDNAAENTDRQSPRRDHRAIPTDTQPADPYGEVVHPPPEKNLGSTAPPADAHSAAPAAGRPQWSSPMVQKPAQQQQQHQHQHQQQHQQQPCDQDPQGHDFHPVSNFTSGQDGGAASTTTTTQHDEIRYPNANAPIAPPTPQAVDPRADSRPLPNDVSAIPDQRYRASQSQPGVAMGNASMMGAAAPGPYGGGFAPSGARRGMMVDVPASQNYNRNLAPNPSAVWKEWSDPDGNTFVFHEATRTLQRRIPNSADFETLVEGTGIISEQDLAQRPMYTGNETTVNVDAKTVRNIENYGMDQPGMMRSIGPVPEGPANRGQYSPSRRTQVEVFAAPQRAQSGYGGRRVHKLTLDGMNNKSQVEHQVQSLESAGLMWDPKSGAAMNASQGASRGGIGMSTLERQWEHVRKVLLQGRYFKKHALRSTQASFRYAFLTSDNSYVVCVPTSEVLLNVNDRDSQKFGSVTETMQYYGSDSRAIALNTITHVSLGIEEEFVRRRSGLSAENVFCIVSNSHAFVLECNTAEEAKYFCDAWTFFLYHSKPLNPKKSKTPQMVAPVNFGTRGGLKW